MSEEIIIKAIEEKRRISVLYGGYHRVIEPHAFGITQDGNKVMRIYQERGGSRSNRTPWWRLMRLDEAQQLELLEEKFAAPRDGYNPRGDKAMKKIIRKI